jgi:molybdopterin-guanine dinucleotide biosynthesis protein A
VPGSPWTAIVLAGGRSSRFGADKTLATLSGRTLLDRVVEALPPDVPCIVAGPRAPSARPSVSLAVEAVPFGGPVAGLAAALPLVTTDLVGVIAADMPFATPALVALVDDLAASPDALEAVLSVDADGRMQQLLGAYRAGALARAVQDLGDPMNRAMRDVIAGLAHRTRRVDHERMLLDVDTADDLREAGRHEPPREEDTP